MPMRRKYRIMQILGNAFGIMLGLAGVGWRLYAGPSNVSTGLAATGITMTLLIQLILNVEHEAAYGRLQAENQFLRSKLVNPIDKHFFGDQ
jgi:hypothetical protein